MLPFFRRKRDLAEFESELQGCTAEKCTVIKCTIGQLEKGKEVVFNVTSRLNTKTIIKVRISF